MSPLCSRVFFPCYRQKSCCVLWRSGLHTPGGWHNEGSTQALQSPAGASRGPAFASLSSHPAILSRSGARLTSAWQWKPVFARSKACKGSEARRMSSGAPRRGPDEGRMNALPPGLVLFDPGVYIRFGRGEDCAFPNALRSGNFPPKDVGERPWLLLSAFCLLPSG